MFLFPEINSISELYDYDTYDDMLGYGKQGSVYRGRVLPAACEGDISTYPSESSTTASSPVLRTGITSLTPGQSVAIKVIKKSCLVSEKDINGVINEVEMLKMLDHPNCVKFYEPLQCTMSIYLVMELVPNATELFTLLDKGSLLHREGTVREITSQLLSGLNYLHRTLHIVHRDIKPENILVSLGNEESGMATSFGISNIVNDITVNNYIANDNNEKEEIRPIRVVIVDFGFAKCIDENDSNSPRFSPPSLDAMRFAEGDKGTFPSCCPQITTNTVTNTNDKDGQAITNFSHDGSALSILPIKNVPSNTSTTSTSTHTQSLASHSDSSTSNKKSPLYPNSPSSDSVDRHYNSPLMSTPCGTFAYLAPETVRGIVNNGGFPIETTKGALLQTDLFSIGVILHVMLTGKLPFNPSKNKFQLIRQYEAGVRLEGDVWKSLTKESRDLVAMLLSNDSKTRPDTRMALAHPWFTCDLRLSSSSSPTNSNTISCLTNTNTFTDTQCDIPLTSSCGGEEVNISSTINGNVMCSPFGHVNSDESRLNDTNTNVNTNASASLCESERKQPSSSVSIPLCSNQQLCSTNNDSDDDEIPNVQCCDARLSYGHSATPDTPLPVSSWDSGVHTNMSNKYSTKTTPIIPTTNNLLISRSEAVEEKPLRQSVYETSEGCSSGRCSRGESIGSARTSHGSALDSDGSVGLPNKNSLLRNQRDIALGIMGPKNINAIIDLFQAHQDNVNDHNNEGDYGSKGWSNEGWGVGNADCCDGTFDDLDDNDAPHGQLAAPVSPEISPYGLDCNDDDDYDINEDDNHNKDKECEYASPYKKYIPDSVRSKDFDNGSNNNNNNNNINNDNNTVYGQVAERGRDTCHGIMSTDCYLPMNRRSTSPDILTAQLWGNNNIYGNMTYQGRRDDNIIASTSNTNRCWCSATAPSGDPSSKG